MLDLLLSSFLETIYNQIVDDALNLARAQQLRYELALEAIEYLKNEIVYMPWKAAFTNLEFILARFKNEEAPIFKVNLKIHSFLWAFVSNNILNIQTFILGLLENVYNHLGFYPKSNDTQLDILNRDIVLKNACKFGHEKCVADARTEFDKLLQNNYT